MILASTISDKLADVYPDFEDAFGFGPCGAYTALKRYQGWGQVAVCIARVGQTEFAHYVIVQGQQPRSLERGSGKQDPD